MILSFIAVNRCVCEFKTSDPFKMHTHFSSQFPFLTIRSTIAYILDISLIVLANSTSVSDISLFPELMNSSSSTNSLVAYVCNEHFGIEINPSSCTNAVALIGASESEHTYGRRGTGTFDVALPQRVISCR